VDWFADAFGGSRVLVIMRGLGVAASLELAAKVWAAGVRLVEIPVQSDVDVAALRAVAAAGAARGLPVGAGTVVRPEQVAVARDAGAVFTVSPGVDADVIAASLAAGLATLPGVATPSDVQRCMRLGLSWLKVFPAAALGPGWIRAVLAPYPGARFVATGGVGVDDAASYLDAGAAAVSLGSALTEPAQLDALSGLVARA
jgi:Entner-Doudoroff aldolase